MHWLFQWREFNTPNWVHRCWRAQWARRHWGNLETVIAGRSARTCTHTYSLTPGLEEQREEIGVIKTQDPRGPTSLVSDLCLTPNRKPTARRKVVCRVSAPTFGMTSDFGAKKKKLRTGTDTVDYIILKCFVWQKRS